MTTDRIPGAAVLLGFGGIVPFVGFAAMHVLELAPPGRTPLEGFLIYSAVILSFLGGIRWGAAVSKAHAPARGLALSVVPSLWALFVVWLAPEWLAIWLMAAGFSFMAVVDWAWPVAGIASWMRHLRVQLSLAVVACHVFVGLY